MLNSTDNFNVEQLPKQRKKCVWWHPFRTGAPDCGSQRPLLDSRKAFCMLWMQCKAPQKSNL